MTRAHTLSIAGKTAIIAALMGGSSLSFAQDAAPTIAAPAPMAPVVAPVPEPIFTPPTAVRTLPTENDVVNPVAAQEAAAEAASRREASAVTKAPARPQTSKPARAAAPATAPTNAVALDAIGEMSSAITPPLVDAIEPVGTTVEDTAAISPVEQPTETAESGVSGEDLTLFGGIAAALAAIGLGAAFASRRRRAVAVDQRIDTLDVKADYVAPRPIREDPVFQQFAATPVQEKVIQRAPIMTRPDVPVTDPLFSTPVSAGPITDPLFAPRNDVERPITDPLFAKHDRFAGRTPAAATTREPQLVG